MRGLIVFTGVGRLAQWPAPTTGGLILSGSLANTSFVGLPMIEAFYGVSFLGVGVLMDQLGTYTALSRPCPASVCGSMRAGVGCG